MFFVFLTAYWSYIRSRFTLVKFEGADGNLINFT